MVSLNEMAAVWNLYLLIGVILISSNGALLHVPNSTMNISSFHNASRGVGEIDLEQKKHSHTNFTKITFSFTDSLVASESYIPLPKSTVVKNEITVSSSQSRFNDAIHFTKSDDGFVNGHQSNMSKDEYFTTDILLDSSFYKKEKAHEEVKNDFSQKYSFIPYFGKLQFSDQYSTVAPTRQPILQKLKIKTERNSAFVVSSKNTSSTVSSSLKNMKNFKVSSENNTNDKSIITTTSSEINYNVYSIINPKKKNESRNKFGSSSLNFVNSSPEIRNVRLTSSIFKDKNSKSMIASNPSLTSSIENNRGTVSSFVLPNLELQKNTFRNATSSLNMNYVLLSLSKIQPVTISASSTILQHTNEYDKSRNSNDSENNPIILELATLSVANISSRLVQPLENKYDNLSSDYQINAYDIFTENYVTKSSKEPTDYPNITEQSNIFSSRKNIFSNLTNETAATKFPNRKSPVYNEKTTVNADIITTNGINLNPNSSFIYKNDNLSDFTTSIEEVVTPFPDNYKVISITNVTTGNTSSLHKEQLQFPGITLKVTHVLIPKQKRSRYNIRDMRIELPKTQESNKSVSNVPETTSKNTNCTRFPIQVITSDYAASKERVNLTEEHYDCEISSEVRSTRQKEHADSIRTYYGGYVFRYAMPKVSVNDSITINQSSTEISKIIGTTALEENDDYYSSYNEYLDSANGTSDTDSSDDGLLPDRTIENKNIFEEKTEAYVIPPISETNSINSDLHDHDVIDSVMYIYFGGASHGQREAGRQIIIVGAVIALVAQFLTLASSIRRMKTHQEEEPTIILLNVEIALTLTNLIFILGVQSTTNHTTCKITAVLLYYLHLATLFWFLLSSVYSVQIICQLKTPFKFCIFCVCGWLLPIIVTLFGYNFNERCFETNLYCWVSPLRGVLFSYILPVIFLCASCTILTVYGLRRVTDTTEDFDDVYSHRKLLKISVVALPLFSIIWFTGMVALENPASLLFSIIFLIGDTVLNWLLFGCWLPNEASQWKDMDEDYYDDEDDFDDEPVLSKRRFDDQPLLSELYEYNTHGGQLYSLRVEPISIISTP